MNNLKSWEYCNMNENKLTPSIRFKNNDGENYPEWDFVKVKEIASINTGNKDTKDAVENGQYDFYVRSPIVHKIDSFTYDGEAVLTVGDGVGVGKVFHYVNGKFDFHQRVYKISDFKDYYGLLFYYYFQKKFLKEAQKYNAKTSVDSVRKSMIADMYVPKIEMSEQIKIGNFFSKLDRQIDLEEQKLAKLEEQKKGYMQKIFSQELRFKDESGNEYPEWEEKKLFDVVKYLSSKRSSNYYSENIIHGQYPVYDAVQEISRDTNFDIEESYISILKDGAGVGRLNLRPGKSSVIGTMGYLLPQNIDIKFLFYYLKTMNFNRFVIGSTIPHLYFKDYSKETLLIPIDKSEQIKIGSFFIKLDRIINNKAKKIKVLKQRKQGFLQKMFV